MALFNRREETKVFSGRLSVRGGGSKKLGFVACVGVMLTATVLSSGAALGTQMPEFASIEEALDFLRTAEIIDVTPVGTGTTNPDKVLLEKNGVRASAIFHEVDNRDRDVRVDETFFRVFHDSYSSDCAAFEVAHLLGMDNVPPTVARAVEGRDGSLQLWIENAMTDTKRAEKTLAPPNTREWRYQTQIMRLFDNLIYNDDRNGGNILVDANWKLWMIDHSRSFQRPDVLREPERVTMVERQQWQRLRTLGDEQFAAVVREYLEPRQVTALIKRRDRLVVYIERLIAERGADLVLFDWPPR